MAEPAATPAQDPVNDQAPSALPPALPLPPSEGPVGVAPTRFRIFKRGSWRKAFRLEDVFWDTLEEAAANEGVKLADYVRRLTGPFGADVNVSSQMRVRAVEWLARRCRALESSNAPDRIMASVLAAPVPCFVISAGRDLVRSNAEFQAYLGQRAGTAGPEPRDSVTMALDAPVARVLALLAAEEGRVLSCGFTIRTATASMSGRARVALVPPGRDLLVGYVLPDDATQPS